MLICICFSSFLLKYTVEAGTIKNCNLSAILDKFKRKSGDAIIDKFKRKSGDDYSFQLIVSWLKLIPNNMSKSMV